MNLRGRRDLANPQAGGITIIVALMLLVLLTVAAVSMSRNSMREIVSSGFTRQGAMARQTADSGLEWSLHWIDKDTATTAPPGGLAENLKKLKKGLLNDPTLSGVAKDVTSASTTAPTPYVPGGSISATELKIQDTADLKQGYTLGLTNMGKLPITMTSQGTGSNAYTPAAGTENKNAPDLWAIRSDAQVIQGGITFVHAREVWASTPL